jgi:hypothetical protein
VRDVSLENRPVTMRMNANENWEDAMSKALRERLGLDRSSQQEVFSVDFESYQLAEEIEYSPTYPGLKTLYRIHEVTCHVVKMHKLLGLPDGNDFTFTNKITDKADLAVTCFTWKPKDSLQEEIRSHNMYDSRSLKDSRIIRDDFVGAPKRKLPAPPALYLPTSPPRNDFVIRSLMAGQMTDWARARHAAQSIRDPAYSLEHFFNDCMAAFPELALYTTTVAEGTSGLATTSGRTGDDEFQRTIGALFAVYWLMRLDMDGAQAFAFGVAADWQPLGVGSRKPLRPGDELRKRSHFKETTNWQLFQDVLVAAGLLKGGIGGTPLVHSWERTLAMLSLTAIHDIMKIQVLLPTVSETHGDFCGYKVGDVIDDHDVALGYVLEFLPDALPSFNGLPASQRESIKFTQSKIEYNMGWLVQGEAPPGALFSKFKSVITSGTAKSSDIAFYFTHWLTDLAGAEPYPQEGCEKFVLKFPQKVLVAFLNSFQIVEGLNSKTETTVAEEYLVWRWCEIKPTLGEIPMGAGSIARMRLVIMAQSHANQILSAYASLHEADRQVLDEELARTGCKGQAYTRNAVRDAGPAFLVYYAPALLQKNGSDALRALQILAEVLRQGRKLWPLQRISADQVVTLQVDAIKGLEMGDILKLNPGEYWALQRTNSKAAQVKKLSLLSDVPFSQLMDANSVRILVFRANQVASDPWSWSSHHAKEGTTVYL